MSLHILSIKVAWQLRREGCVAFYSDVSDRIYLINVSEKHAEIILAHEILHQILYKLLEKPLNANACVKFDNVDNYCNLEIPKHILEKAFKKNRELTKHYGIK
jgi:hypothetical protein